MLSVCGLWVDSNYSRKTLSRNWIVQHCGSIMSESCLLSNPNIVRPWTDLVLLIKASSVNHSASCPLLQSYQQRIINICLLFTAPINTNANKLIKGTSTSSQVMQCQDPNLGLSKEKRSAKRVQCSAKRNKGKGRADRRNEKFAQRLQIHRRQISIWKKSSWCINDLKTPRAKKSFPSTQPLSGSPSPPPRRMSRKR